MERDGFSPRLNDHTITEASPKLQSLPHPVSDHPPVRTYQRLKLVSSVAQSALVFVLTLAFIASGLSVALENVVRTAFANNYAALLAFAVIAGSGESVVSFPLRFFSGFVLEHRFGLSNQTFSAWLWERAKGSLVAIPLMTLVLGVLYYCLVSFGDAWWLPVGITVFVLSVLLARLAPVLIFPLFYSFKPLDDGLLKERLLELCSKAGVAVKGLFVFDMSRNTKKANAAFTGIGRAKRILLGDTLVANFTDDEIATVFAHELAHQTHSHVWKMMAFGALTSFPGLFLTAQLYEASLTWFGFGSRTAFAALPLLGLWLGLYSLFTTPLTNAVSRRYEREADAYAVRLSGNKEAFLNALKKLGRINLADDAPHPLVEFLWYIHPSLGRRIRAVEAMP